MSDKPVSNISVSYNIALVTIYRLPYDTRLLSDIFNGIAQKNINIDMISQSPPYRGIISLSFSLPADKLVDALSVLNGFKAIVKDLRVEVDADNTKLQVYGEGMRNMPVWLPVYLHCSLMKVWRSNWSRLLKPIYHTLYMKRMLTGL